MGERERGNSKPATEATQGLPNSLQPVPTSAQAVLDPPTLVPSNAEDARGSLGSWAAGWRDFVWEKWRWGALIAIAVLVSRLSSG